MLTQQTSSFTKRCESRDRCSEKRKENMSRTIEAITRHMTLPSNGITNLRNGTEKLEKEITVRKRHYLWSEARFVRAMMPFHSNVRVTYNGTEVHGKNVLDLMTLALPEGSTVRVRVEGPDAAKAMRALEELIRSHPDENKKAA
jgi:phosphocarrier protein HPr